MPIDYEEWPETTPLFDPRSLMRRNAIWILYRNWIIVFSYGASFSVRFKGLGTCRNAAYSALHYRKRQLIDISWWHHSMQTCIRYDPGPIRYGTKYIA